MAAGRVVAVAGGGFSGAMAAVHLVAAGAEAVLVERRERFAAGAAYSTEDDGHLLNVRARNMSALPDAPDHFLAWVKRERLGDAETYVPRKAYRRYVAGILDEAVASGRLRLVHGTAVAADADGLVLDGGARIACERLILAGGNYPSRLPRIFEPLGAGAVHDPWSAQGAAQLQALARQPDDVLLVGTGLTMVDICLTLSNAGYGGRMVATSRRGLVPHGHEALGTPPLPPPAPGPLLAMLRDVRARAESGGWRPAVDSLRPVSAAVWHGLGEAEQRRFLRHLRPWWDIHRHRIAPPVAARIAALRRSGRLEIVPGRVTRVGGAGAIEVDIARRGGGGVERRRFAGVVNCTGPEGAIAAVQDPLIRQMLASGMARKDRLGIALDVDPAGRLIGADGQVSDRFFALGPLTRGTFWEIVAVPDIRSQAMEVARLAAAY